MTKRTEKLELGLNIELTRVVLSTISTGRGKRKVIELLKQFHVLKGRAETISFYLVTSSCLKKSQYKCGTKIISSHFSYKKPLRFHQTYPAFRLLFSSSLTFRHERVSSEIITPGDLKNQIKLIFFICFEFR